ncbi:MAG: glutathione S-transferase family protein [Sphingomonadaceae bacterium]|uniref:glutathione S-transferase family protein n=1 Tax=Thermaurantiacus sp. TaxID=2820283 RepID=UPI00298EE672|nr:glutathione S-transferase family protein [Thermaurantiacus sp.]MCS6986890.1 glutathione S-transferase family protein [Sphingomonadaceae bacterium]MDW8415510.1 glutathione S-transferase family protein [Thermaurantiacus sp.]
MRLYDGAGPNPRIVRRFAAEKGIALPRVAVDVIGGENRRPAYLALNPLGGVPALELDDGQVVTEVVAICEFLEDLWPDPPLVGRTPAERAETRMWVRRFDLCILEPFTLGFRAAVARDFFSPRMPLLSAEAGRELLDHAWRNLAVFDGLLAGRAFVCGERFSLADITLAAFVGFAGEVGLEPPPGLSWVPEWRARVEARPSSTA